DWTLMALSIPEQSLILFSVLLILHVLILMRIVKSAN
ncbi:disulfide bond formation protein B, partial [Psychrobacter sp. SIMBA_152]